MVRTSWIAVGALFCSSTFAGSSPHLLARIGCAQHLVDSNSDPFLKRDSVGTQQLKDLRYLLSLSEFVRKIEFDLSHSRAFRLPTPSHGDRRLPTAQKQLLRFVENIRKQEGEEGVVALYGAFYLHTLMADDSAATASVIYLESLRDAYKELAAITQYLYLWRENWLKHQGYDSNKSIALWSRKGRFDSQLAFETQKDEISALTEKALSKSGSRAYAPRRGETLVSLGDWNKHFLTGHLPKLGKRALDYIQDNLTALPIVYTPVLEGAVARACLRIRALDRVAHEPSSH